MIMDGFFLLLLVNDHELWFFFVGYKAKRNKGKRGKQKYKKKKKN